MEFPVDTRKIDFVHKEMIEKIRSEHGHILSSHAFASLYLWQHAMGLSLICNEDFFAVHCGGRASNTWFFPCGDERKTHDFIVGRMSEKPFSLRYLRECDVRWLEDNFPGKWRFGRDESSDEYICDISEYISLAGSKFSEIRRKIRKIDREHSITVKEISDSTLHDAMRVAKRWYATEHHIGADGLSDDMIAEIALGERAGLNINGVVVYADGAPVSLFAVSSRKPRQETAKRPAGLSARRRTSISLPIISNQATVIFRLPVPMSMSADFAVRLTETADIRSSATTCRRQET